MTGDMSERVIAIIDPEDTQDLALLIACLISHTRADASISPWLLTLRASDIRDALYEFATGEAP